MKEIFDSLKEKNREIFNRIFEIEEKEIELKDWKNDEFKKQKIVYIKNKILKKEVVVNLSRKKRKQPEKREIPETYDPFCNFNELTPTDELGRLENDFAVTASNLSKMADYHSLVIFKKHNFDDLNLEDFKSAWELSIKWFEGIKNLDKNIKSQILIWNYNFRAGASILHPHFQVLSYNHNPLPLIEISEKIKNYKEKYRSEFFDDYFYLAKSLNLGDEKEGMKIFIDLTPEKEKGLIIYGKVNKSNIKFLWEVLMKLKNHGTESFNFFYIYDSDLIKDLGFFVDRGEVSKLNSDFGSLEIFLIPVISTDFFELGKEIFSS